MGNVISLAAYKAEKGIVPTRSPYSTSNATSEQIQDAARRAQKLFSAPTDYRGMPPYAVVIGYEDKQGRVRLLRGPIAFPTKRAFETMAGMKTMKTVALIHDNGL